MSTSGGATVAACTPCRTVKMKCIREPDSIMCNRCKRKSLSCFYETHRRGRKPGTKLRPKAERLKDSNAATALTNMHRNIEPAATHVPMEAGDIPPKVEPDDVVMRYQSNQFISDTKPNLSPISKDDVGGNVTPKQPRLARSMASESLAPFALLRKSAAAGNFSIANILNVEDGSPGGEETSNPDVFRESDSPIDDPDDPVNANLVNMPSAQGLFDNFFKYMNPFICQFDPALHTLRYIRSRSSFLFSALLAAASKVFSPQLYPGLHNHVERLLRGILGSGQKSTEIVQGICLVTHWKEPSDSRAWMLVGYAIRACMEMGWHKLNPTNLEAGPEENQIGYEKELELRERRNRERTWLMLFIYDRSVSLQLGRPSMIHMDSLIRNAESWHEHRFAVPGIDEVMVAFAQLRTLGFDLLDVFWLHPTASTPQAIEKDEFILKTFNSDLDRWEAKWFRIIDEADSSISHKFQVRFYGHHLRLLIHSFRLQLSILSGSVSKQSLWICYSSATEMLRLVVNRLGTTSHLYYCQDSVHVMVAYAAVATIKILLSMPGELSAESENTILELLLKASDDFGRQCSANNTGCYYQSRFLANVVSQYRKSKAKGSDPKSSFLKEQHYDGHRDSDQPNTPSTDTTRPAFSRQNSHNLPPLYTSSQTNSSNLLNHLPHDGYSGSATLSTVSPHASEFSGTHFQQHSANPLSNSGQSAASFNAVQGFSPNSATVGKLNALAAISSDSFAGPSLHQLSQMNIPINTGPNNGGGGLQNHHPFASFTDNGVWENLFAHAGFNISNGAFIPNLDGDKGTM